MTPRPTGPGKTSPKLYLDLLSFDPIKGRPNLLAEHTPPHGEGVQLAAPIGSCKHEYATKVPQSVLPPLDLRPDGTTSYKIAVVCKRCRIHADVFIDHSNATNPCPASENPLHHFQRVTSLDHTTTDRIKYVWSCSVESCRAALYIMYRKSRLSDEDLHLLTYPELLMGRYEELVRDDPKREGMRVATSMDALSRLRKYIKDALNPQHTKRQFPSNNKRFQEAFGINGQDCADILKRLGFQYSEHAWTLPNPEQIPDRLAVHGETHREVLEDVEMELLARMYKLAAEQGFVNPAADEGWYLANRDLERTLAAQGYPRHASLRRTPALNTELPFFNSLGALPDFGDGLIEYAYDRQVSCHPEQQAYYFECLQEISDSRNSERLQTKVAVLQSQDIVSRRDILAAYRYLSIPPGLAKDIDNARILEIFQARQPDLGPNGQEEARAHLGKLGVARQSNLLINASRQSVDTYEDALSWLGNGVTKETPDESIIAVLGVKTAENQANEEIGQKAISVIAKARQSNTLNGWLLTGRMDGYTMSVDEALRHLNIEQSLEQLDPSIVPAIFDSARQDRPGETTEKAISTIQQAMTYSNGGTTVHTPDTWPVGLTSHGNTCYLNSLLQYYFSIQPLRDIILDYDKYKLDTASHTEKEARVGQRKVSIVEIKGGQRFAHDLSQLFQRMIKSPDSAVKPEEDLVCRAFLDPRQYRLLDAGSKDDSLSNADKPMTNGITLTDSNPFTDDAQVLASPLETSAAEQNHSEASSVTLQASVNGDDPDGARNPGEMPPTPPASPGLKAEDGVSQTDTVPAPPLPPRRRFSTAKEEALDIAKSKARQQQDVTEVHDGAMFRLRCGMMPRDRDSSGEQVDAMRDLFNILIEETIVNKGVEQPPKVLADSNIQLNVPYEPTNIYSALDAVFDLQPYGENSSMETYKSIKALPPLLQINIPRIGYSANGAFKANECVRLEDELYLDRYLDDGNPKTLAARRQCWGWRKRLQALRLEQKVLSKTTTDLDGPTIVAQTAEYLTSLDEVNRDLESIGVERIAADGEITGALKADAEQQASRLASLDYEINVLQRQVDAEFKDMTDVAYRLAAVFFHRGQHGHGHYWIYIHDFANNLWRSYNDERVEEFTKLDEIFEAKTFAHGTPTYAVYVAADKLHTIAPVCRDPEAPPSPPPIPAVHVEREIEMVDRADEHGNPGTFVNPKLTLEGGGQAWDECREVGDAQWSDVVVVTSIEVLDVPSAVRSHALRHLEFARSLKLERQRVDAVARSRSASRSRSRSRSISPGKRRGPGSPVSPPKLRKVDEREELDDLRLPPPVLDPLWFKDSMLSPPVLQGVWEDAAIPLEGRYEVGEGARLQQVHGPLPTLQEHPAGGENVEKRNDSCAPFWEAVEEAFLLMEVEDSGPEEEQQQGEEGDAEESAGEFE